MSVGYFSNLLSTFKSSILYALTNVVLSLPFWALKLLFLEIYLTISINNIFISYVGMVLLSGLWIFIDSMKIAIFSCYSGHSVEFDYSPLKTFSNSVPLTIKNFLNILSNSVILELTIIVATGFIALFTFFAGLVLVIPAGFVLTSIFYIVVYLNKSGQRYYLNNNFIFNPVKYTIKQDEFVSVNIPEEPVEEQVVTTILSKNIKKKKHKHKKKNNKS